MDTSLSAKKDKDKGKSKKYKKEKKEKKEKKGKEKQTISIDLTSPARAHTPPPGPDAAAPTAAAHTPTRAPSRQSGKRRGRSTTRREEAQPSASVSRNDHTYNSRPLPLFSSNDSKGLPSTGTNAVRPYAKSAAAVPDRPRANDIERSSYNHDCKIKTLETCLSLKDRYLAMPPAVQTDQEPFWTQVRDFLEHKSITRGKFKDWQAVQRGIESWCQPRRSSMREERLPAVSQSHPELDELVDQWNLVFAQRFCKIHIGYFSNAIWPQFAEEKVTEMVESNLNARVADILTKRCEALQKPNPSALLPTNSSLEDYGNARKAMNSQLAAAQTIEDQVRKSEAVMSMVLELQPGLRAALSQSLSGHTAASRERVNSTIPLSQTAPPALQRPSKRPRLDSHSSDLPPANNFALGGRDSYGARTPSSQRPRPPQRPKTSYGPIAERPRTNPDKMPPMTPCPTGHGPTTGPRTDVPRHLTDSYQTPGNSQPTRHHGQRQGDRQVPGDYSRPDSTSRRRSNW